MAIRSDIRNIAIIAHVDHGKTTLVDALLWQSGAFRSGQAVADRVLDSMDLDPEQAGTDLRPLLDAMVEHVPAPEFDPDRPLQAHVTNLDASPYVGRLAICRVRRGTITRGATAAWCRADGTIERVKISELYVTEALERVEADEASAGEIISVAGIAEITIGDTLTDPDDPQPLPVITVDEPSL